MLKSIFRTFRFGIIGILWTYVFILCANFLMFWLWNFNFLSAHSWQTISSFWQSGGVIKSGKDYVFLIMLISIPFLWILGWRFFSKLSYINILLYPIIAYNSHVIKKYGQNSSRVVLKNLKSSQKMIEEIKSQLESIKPENTKEVHNLRQQINQTITDEIKSN